MNRRSDSRRFCVGVGDEQCRTRGKFDFFSMTPENGIECHLRKNRLQMGIDMATMIAALPTIVVVTTGNLTDGRDSMRFVERRHNMPVERPRTAVTQRTGNQ